MMGLVSHVVWVVPSWDTSMDDEDEKDFEHDLVKLGYVEVTVYEGKDIFNTIEFCECHYVNRENPICAFLNSTSDTEVKITEDKCIFKTSYTATRMRDYRAIQLLKEDTLFKKGNVILDIDEDYFGCELASGPLVKASFDWNNIYAMDWKISEFLCPSTGQKEEETDIFLRDLILHVKYICDWSDKTSGCKIPVKELVEKTQDDVIKFWVDHPSNLCGRTDARVLKAWREVITVLVNFNQDQIEALLDVGFCFRQSPVSWEFSDTEQGSMQICHGANTPDQENLPIFLYSPEEDEITERAVELQNILTISAKMASHSLVTICRSVRDGYTPREHAMQIEKLILDVVEKSYSQYRIDTIYDTNLLGGQGGWSHRTEYGEKYI